MFRMEFKADLKRLNESYVIVSAGHVIPIMDRPRQENKLLRIT